MFSCDYKSEYKKLINDYEEELLPGYPANEAPPETYENPEYALASGRHSDNDNKERLKSYSSSMREVSEKRFF